MTLRATYRLQLNAAFGFGAAAEVVPYLAALGASHAYCSPYLKARPGSAHGYDIVDHDQLNPELGDALAFRTFSAVLRQHELGQILDFVPNHIGVGGADNPLWLDVLEWGPDAARAPWFDIDWDPEHRYLHNKLLVPFLGNQYGIELERGALRLQFDETAGSFAVWAYGTHKLPVWPPHYARILIDGHLELERLADAFAWLPNSRGEMPRRAAELKSRLATLIRERPDARAALEACLQRFEGREQDSASWRELHQLIRDQYWRLAHFRVAADDINYRRFFNINDLAALRMELPEVFDHAHRRVLQLLQEGVLDGLRIDHIDGLYDPKAYLRRLREQVDQRHSGTYIVVEKILSPHEHLREDWPIEGTTGYDFLNQVLSIQIDPAAEQLFTETYAEFTGERRGFAEIARLSKLHIMENEMASELDARARDVARLARQNPRTADFTQNLLRRAIKELIACFPVYRTYVDTSGVLDAEDQRDLSWAFAQARRNESEIDPSVFDFLAQVLDGSLVQQPRSGYSLTAALRCAMRLQQYSGPVVAKGTEDTAFYRYQRLIALNEVGGDPSRFGGTLTAFHRANQSRAQRFPAAMLATATHDTKRGEDARARLAALSEYGSEWTRQLPIWSRILRGPAGDPQSPRMPDCNDEYLLYQLLLGTWPAELLQGDSPDAKAMNEYAERMRATMIKSIREARVHTTWAFPNAEYERATTELLDAVLIGSRAGAFLAAFLPTARALAASGAYNSLLQTVLKLTVPGVPDIYHGAELWDLSMVDPDNRRPVDFESRTRALRELQEWLRSDRIGCVRALWRGWQDGRIKLAVLSMLLARRRECPELYRHGDYQPLPVGGEHGEEVCAFARTHATQAMIVAVARFPRRRESQPLDERTLLAAPESLRGRSRWRELLTGTALAAGAEWSARQLFTELPVAVLVPDDA
jgi:(1->4)-alpha-D-glucan 1-alpha-D-glucosylmutase